MSSKSDGQRQRVRALEKQVASLQKFIARTDKGTHAIVQMLRIYGTHLNSCPKVAPSVEGAEPAPCHCQWDQARVMLFGPDEATPVVEATPVAAVVEATPVAVDAPPAP